MTENREFEALIAKFRELLAIEYRRGEQEAIARIVKAARPENATHAANGREIPAKKTKGGNQRAPKGTAGKLVQRILSERNGDGATPSEIHAAADTTLEKMVSFSGIRFELDRGRAAKRYRNGKGKWYLV